MTVRMGYFAKTSRHRGVSGKTSLKRGRNAIRRKRQSSVTAKNALFAVTISPISDYDGILPRFCRHFCVASNVMPFFDRCMSMASLLMPIDTSQNVRSARRFVSAAISTLHKKEASEQLLAILSCGVASIAFVLPWHPKSGRRSAPKGAPPLSPRPERSGSK